MLSLNELLKVCFRVANNGKKICIQAMGEIDKSVLELLESNAVETVKGDYYAFKYKNGLIEIHFAPKREGGIYTQYKTVSGFDEVYLPLSSRLNKTLAAIKSITQAAIYTYNDYTTDEIDKILRNLSLEEKSAVLMTLKKDIDEELEMYKAKIRGVEK